VANIIEASHREFLIQGPARMSISFEIVVF